MPLLDDNVQGTTGHQLDPVYDAVMIGQLDELEEDGLHLDAD